MDEDEEERARRAFSESFNNFVSFSTPPATPIPGLSDAELNALFNSDANEVNSPQPAPILPAPIHPVPIQPAPKEVDAMDIDDPPAPVAKKPKSLKRTAEEVLPNAPSPKSPRVGDPVLPPADPVLPPAGLIPVPQPGLDFPSYHQGISIFKFWMDVDDGVLDRFNKILHKLHELKLLSDLEVTLKNTSPKFQQMWLTGVNTLIQPFVKEHTDTEGKGPIRDEFINMVAKLHPVVANARTPQDIWNNLLGSTTDKIQLISNLIMFASGVVPWESTFDRERIFGRDRPTHLPSRYYQFNFAVFGQLTDILDQMVQMIPRRDTSFCFFSHPAWWFYIYPFDTLANQTHNLILLALLNQCKVIEPANPARKNLFQLLKDQKDPIFNGRIKQDLVDEVIAALILGHHFEKASASYRINDTQWDSLLHHELFHLEEAGAVAITSFPDIDKLMDKDEQAEAKLDSYQNGFIIAAMIDELANLLQTDYIRNGFNVTRNKSKVLLQSIVKCLVGESHDIIKSFQTLHPAQKDDYSIRRAEVLSSQEMKTFMITFGKSVVRHAYAFQMMDENDTADTLKPNLIQVIETLEWTVIENMIERILDEYFSSSDSRTVNRNIFIYNLQSNYMLDIVDLKRLYPTFISGFSVESDQKTYNTCIMDLTKPMHWKSITTIDWADYDAFSNMSMKEKNQYGLLWQLQAQYGKLYGEYVAFYRMTAYLNMLKNLSDRGADVTQEELRNALEQLEDEEEKQKYFIVTTFPAMNPPVTTLRINTANVMQSLTQLDNTAANLKATSADLIATFKTYYKNSLTGKVPAMVASWESLPFLSTSTDFNAQKTLQLVNLLHAWADIYTFREAPALRPVWDAKLSQGPDANEDLNFLTHKFDFIYQEQVDSKSNKISRIRIPEKKYAPRFYFPYTPLDASPLLLNEPAFRNPFLRSLYMNNTLQKESNLVLGCMDIASRVFAVKDIISATMNSWKAESTSIQVRRAPQPFKFISSYCEYTLVNKIQNGKHGSPMTEEGQDRIIKWNQEDIFDLMEHPVKLAKMNDEEITTRFKDLYEERGYAITDTIASGKVVEWGSTDENLKKRFDMVMHLLSESNLTHVPIPLLDRLNKTALINHEYNAFDQVLFAKEEASKTASKSKSKSKSSSSSDAKKPNKSSSLREEVTTQGVDDPPTSLVGAQVYKTLLELDLSVDMAIAYWTTYGQVEYDANGAKLPSIFQAFQDRLDEWNRLNLDEYNRVNQQKKKKPPPPTTFTIIQKEMETEVQDRLRELLAMKKNITETINSPKDHMNLSRIFDFEPILMSLKYLRQVLSVPALARMFEVIGKNEELRKRAATECSTFIDLIEKLVQTLHHLNNQLLDESEDSNAPANTYYQEGLVEALSYLRKLKVDLRASHFETIYQPIAMAVDNLVGAASDMVTHFVATNYTALHHTIFANPATHPGQAMLGKKYVDDDIKKKLGGVPNYLTDVVKNLLKTLPLNMAFLKESVLLDPNARDNKDDAEIRSVEPLFRAMKMRMHPMLTYTRHEDGSVTKDGAGVKVNADISNIYTEMLAHTKTNFVAETFGKEELSLFDSVSFILGTLNQWANNWTENMHKMHPRFQPLLTIATLSSVQTLSDWTARTWFNQEYRLKTKQNQSEDKNEGISNDSLLTRNILAIPFTFNDNGLTVAKKPSNKITTEQYNEQQMNTIFANTAYFNYAAYLALGADENLVDLNMHSNILGLIDVAVDNDLYLLPWTKAHGRYWHGSGQNINSNRDTPNSIAQIYKNKFGQVTNTVSDRFIVPSIMPHPTQTYETMLASMQLSPMPAFDARLNEPSSHQQNFRTIDPFLHFAKGLDLTTTKRDTYTPNETLRQIYQNNLASLNPNAGKTISDLMEYKLNPTLTGHNGVAQLLQLYLIVKAALKQDIKSYRNELIQLITKDTIIYPIAPTPAENQTKEQITAAAAAYEQAKEAEAERQRQRLERLLSDETIDKVKTALEVFTNNLTYILSVIRIIPENYFIPPINPAEFAFNNNGGGTATAAVPPVLNEQQQQQQPMNNMVFNQQESMDQSTLLATQYQQLASALQSDDEEEKEASDDDDDPMVAQPTSPSFLGITTVNGPRSPLAGTGTLSPSAPSPSMQFSPVDPDNPIFASFNLFPPDSPKL